MITWKRISFYSWAVILVLIILLTWKRCGKNTEYIKIKVPAVTGNFKPQVPTYIPRDKPVIVELQGRKTEIENPVNDSLLKAFQSAQQENDSLKQLLLYVDAIQIREFKNHFEDEYLSLDVFTTAQGYVKNVRTDYTIKEREVIHELESTRLRILLGGQLGTNRDFNSMLYKLDLGFQNAKGNIIEGSYLRINGEDYGLIGGKLSVFDIK